MPRRGISPPPVVIRQTHFCITLSRPPSSLAGCAPMCLVDGSVHPLGLSDKRTFTSLSFFKPLIRTPASLAGCAPSCVVDASVQAMGAAIGAKPPPNPLPNDAVSEKWNQRLTHWRRLGTGSKRRLRHHGGKHRPPAPVLLPPHAPWAPGGAFMLAVRNTGWPPQRPQKDA